MQEVAVFVKPIERKRFMASEAGGTASHPKLRDARSKDIGLCAKSHVMLFALSVRVALLQ
jgi:hypothetical protein